MKSLALSFIVAIAAAGCASLPPIDLVDTYAQPGANLHVVTVERPSRWPGGADLVIWVDGKPAAGVGPGQATNLYLPAGRHIVGVGMPARSGYDRPERTVAIDVGEGIPAPILRAGTVAMGYGGWEIEVVDQ